MSSALAPAGEEEQPPRKVARAGLFRPVGFVPARLAAPASAPSAARQSDGASERKNRHVKRMASGPRNTRPQPVARKRRGGAASRHVRCGRLDLKGHHFDTGPTLLIMPLVYEAEFGPLWSVLDSASGTIPSPPRLVGGRCAFGVHPPSRVTPQRPCRPREHALSRRGQRSWSRRYRVR